MRDHEKSTTEGQQDPQKRAPDRPTPGRSPRAWLAWALIAAVLIIVAALIAIGAVRIGS